MTAISNPLGTLSNQLADSVDRAAASVVRIDDGSRLTASGVVWSSDGVIVTTSHGVERDEDLAITSGDGTSLAATLVGRDPDTDIAVLRVDANSLTAVLHAPAESARVGSLALAVARPGYGGLYATLGIITTRIETQSNGTDEYILQTDAALYPGFSGGALVDVEGRMLGMINLMFRRGKGIAVGLPVVAHTVDALLAHGKVQRGYLGIRTQAVQLSDSLRQALSLTQQIGLLLMQVESGTPAEKGGLMMGDTLIALDGQPIDDVELLRRKLRSMKAGQVVVVRIIRGGALTEFGVTLGAEA